MNNAFSKDMSEITHKICRACSVEKEVPSEIRSHCRICRKCNSKRDMIRVLSCVVRQELQRARSLKSAYKRRRLNKDGDFAVSPIDDIQAVRIPVGECVGDSS
jgi:hypothetical protein